MKECSTLQAIQEIHVRAKLRFLLTQIKMSVLKKMNNKCGTKGKLQTLSAGMHASPASTEASPSKPQENLPPHLATALAVTYPQDSTRHRDTRAAPHTAPVTEDQVRTVSVAYTVDFFTPIKNNLMLSKGQWM